MTSQLAKVRLVGLIVWVVGVQVSEGVATVGMALTALTLLPLLRPVDARAWWPVWAWLGWCLLGPWLVGGQPPSGAGVARTFDWLMVPLLAVGLSGTPGLRAVLYATGATLAVSSVVAGLQHVGAWPSLETFSALEWL
ncbi:MAG: hypothetical protein JNG84_13535, partial [Archangium sp.]|nr:hypothetical protein [Archangium sp.]